MNIEKLKETLRLAEGCRMVPYDDATGLPFKIGDTLKGNLTVGIGHNLMGGWQSEVLDYLLETDITNAVNSLSKNFFPATWLTIDDVRQRAITEMMFNLGYSKFKQFQQMVSAIRQRDWTTAAAQIRNSVAYRELTSRYERITGMIETGIDP